MPSAIRALVLTLILGTGLFLTITARQPASAVLQCDPSYPELCLTSGLGISCLDIGFPIVVIRDSALGAYDPYFLDPDFDGIGCEEF